MHDHWYTKKLTVSEIELLVLGVSLVDESVNRVQGEVACRRAFRYVVELLQSPKIREPLMVTRNNSIYTVSVDQLHKVSPLKCNGMSVYKVGVSLSNILISGVCCWVFIVPLCNFSA